MEQTYTNIEILCIDDCGQDNSTKIVEQLKQEDKRIKLIKHKKNKGLGGARNTGLKKAKGKYILFIDSDDWITNDCVSVTVNALNKTGLNAVWFKAKYWIEPLQTSAKMDFCEWYNNLPNTYKTLNHYNIGNFPVATWNKAYRVDYLKAKKLSWQENVIYEDVEFYWKLFTQSPQIYVLDNFLYYYRQREGSIVQENMKSTDKTQVPLNVMLRVYKYLKANNLYDKYKQSFIKFASDNISMFDKVINNNEELKKEKLKFLQKIL